MNRSKLAAIAFMGAGSLAVAACSEETQQSGSEFAQDAARDTEANAEVAAEAIEDAAIVAADEISEGAAEMRDELANDEAAEAPTDGELDGAE